MGADRPSGSGKSTLFHAVSGLLTPTSGEIVVDGKDVAKLREKEKCDFRAKEIGCIFQKPMLMPYLTVFENLRLSASIAGKTLTREEAECLLASVGLSEYAPRRRTRSPAEKRSVSLSFVQSSGSLPSFWPMNRLRAWTAQTVSSS